MIFNFVINAIFLFLFGFLLVGKDKYFNNEINEKLSYIWHIFLKKLDLKDNYILLLSKKFLESNNENSKICEKFNENFQLECDENYNYSLKIRENNLTRNQVEILRKQKEKNEIVDVGPINIDKRELEVEVVEEKKEISINFKKNDNEIIRLKEKKVSTASKSFNNYVHPTINLNHPISLDLKSKKVVSGKNNINKLKKSSSHLIINPNKINEINCKPHKCPNIQASVYSIDNFQKEENDEEKLEILSLNEILENNRNDDIEKYYDIIFEIIADQISIDQTYDLNVEKVKIFQNINKAIPIFPIVKGIAITRSRVKQISEEWTKLNNYVVDKKLQLKLSPNLNPISLNMILSKIISPPIIGCVVGILLGIANMNHVIISTNHYLSNMTTVLRISYRAFVPLVMITTGVVMFSTKGLNINSPFTKYNLLITFIVRGLLIPWIGIGYMYLWINNIGGIAKTDKVVRLAMYVPWALPSAQNYTIVCNLLNYYNEELGYILKWHNALIFFTVTLNLLIYFSLVGL